MNTGNTLKTNNKFNNKEIEEQIVENASNFDEVPEGYVRVCYHGNSAEIGKNTYVYQVDNGDNSVYYEYIVVKWSTKHWGSSEYDKSIYDKGIFKLAAEMIKYLKVQSPTAYVAVPGKIEVLTIDEFEEYLNN